MTNYPARIDNSTSLPQAIDNLTAITGEVFNRLQEAVIAIETELGIKPSGTHGTVRGRLDAIEAGGGGGGGGGGTNFVAGLDLAGSATSQTVIGFFGRPLASSAPVNSAVFVWDTNLYDLRQLTQDDILPGFSITSFNGGTITEIGATVVNPAFTATYSGLPTSAHITNTDNIDSPLNLVTPFTSGTVIGSFVHNTATNVIFTLTATASATKTATQNLFWEPRSFGGVGSASATATVTASGNNAVLSTSDVINNLGLHTSDVGQVYGPFSPSGQKIYLLIIGGSHTFVDNNTGFLFPFLNPTAVSFINQHGATVSMFLYESTNILNATFTIKVTG